MTSDLLIAMNTFFQKGNLPNRTRPVVYQRTAFANAFKDVAKVVDIARVLDVHHATVIHYKKNHDALSMYGDYIELYNDAVQIRNEIAKDGNNIETELWSKDKFLREINELKIVIDYLKMQVNKMSMYKEKYEAIKTVLDSESK
jgi:hypothetical protein